MQTTPPIANEQQLWKILEDSYGVPVDDTNHQSWMYPLSINSDEAREAFESDLENTFLYHSKGGRNETHTENLRRHWRVVLLNLALAVFQKRWLLVPTDNNYYSDGNFWPERLGMKKDATRHIVKWLRDTGHVEWKQGKVFKRQPMKTRIFPKSNLQSLIWHYFFHIEQKIEPPYVIFSNASEQWQPLRDYKRHPEREPLEQINEFLKSHHWACKGPVQMKLTRTGFEGGRLYTPFQNLPDRRARIRINTFINGQPIGEVDFSANHLRLCLATFAKEDAGATPYEDIGELARITGTEKEVRDKVKNFLMVAMGSSDERGASYETRRHGIKAKEFEAINAACRKRYPRLKLFDGFGVFAQNLEGQILKQVMLEGIKKDIVCLPVHDAVAVQQEHLDWARDTMLECWDRQMEASGLARVKVDLP